MDINVKVATILLKKADPVLTSTSFGFEAPDGIEVTGLIEMLGIPRALVGSVTVNKKRSPLDTTLKDGDLVAIVPAISGG